MFTLKKILNHSGSAEPVRMPTTAGVAYKLGSLLILKDGALTNCATTDFPEFVAGETVGADERETIICYPILSDMVFETPASSSVTSLVPGAKLTLSLLSGFAVRVAGISDTGVASVYDTQCAAKSGDRILVRFIK